MSMHTKDGRPVTDEMLDEWPEAYERGEWPEGKTVVMGRPRLADEEVRPVTFKLPVSPFARSPESARALRHEVAALRQAVDDYLAQA